MLICWRAGPQSQTWQDYNWLIAIGILARLILIPVDPYLSNDIDRYLFDGKVALLGLDPYRTAHNAPELSSIIQQWQPPAEHTQYASLYPPAAMLFFTLSATAGELYAPLVWKSIVTAASVATLWLCMKILIQARRLQYSAFICLSPLLILEAGVGAHLDTLMTLAVCAAIYAWQKQRLLYCGLFIAIGTLLKLLPLSMLAPLFFATKSISKKVSLTLTTVTTLVLGYLLAFAAGWVPLGSLPVFFEKWRFGSPVYRSLEAIFPANILSILLVFGVLMGILFSIVVATGRLTLSKNTVEAQSKTEANESNLFYALAIIMTTPLVFSPVVFPWYLMTLVPLLALTASRFLLLWTLSLPLTYEVLGQFACCNHWQPATWPLWVVAVCMVIALIAALRRRL